MVESSTRGQIYQSLVSKARAQFEKAEELPVVIKKEDGNVLIRQTWDGDRMVSVAEAKVVEGLAPEDFMEFLVRWDEVGLEANKRLTKIELVDEVEGNKVCKVQVKTPWPIWRRVLINTHYGPNLDAETGELIMLFSDQGNEELKQKHFSANDKKNYVLAT